MIQQEFRLVRTISGFASRALPIASLSALFCACSSDVVNMGDDANEPPAAVLPAHSLCLESTTLSGDFVARSQVDIDALEGCEVVEGNLLVQPYFDPDLRPLHALTTVSGELGLGSSGVWSPDEPPPEDEAARAAAWENGFMESLEGLENLESVGSMLVVRASIHDLEPLENLRTVHGSLTLVQCDEITDLRPLAGLLIRELVLNLNNVESLAGLHLHEYLKLLIISGEKLVDIDALATVRAVDQDVTIQATALRDLHGLGQLEHVGGDMYVVENPALQTLDGLDALEHIQEGLIIRGNAALERPDGLDALRSAGFILVEQNDRLRRLPEFPTLDIGALYFWDNLALEELPDFLGVLASRRLPSGYNVFDVPDLFPRRDWLSQRSEIIIARNPALQRFSVPLGLRGGTYVSIEGNTQLRELNFSELESIDVLEIRDNTTLTQISLGALATVDSLKVTGNPLLPMSTFDAVRTFESTVSGSAESVP